ncbi:MAG: SGNH/GDSL hydrolase family protein [Pseudomonadota bacterium]
MPTPTSLAADLSAISADLAVLATTLDTKAAEVGALTTGGAPLPLTWPTGIDCLGGTVPSTISLPSGDTDSGGFPEPSYSRRKMGTRSGSVHIFGDSIIQPIPGSMISPFGVNFAIGGQSLRRLINSWHSHAELHDASAIVMLSGVNDMLNTGYYGSYSGAVSTILWMYANPIKNWVTGPIVVSHLMPVVNTRSDHAAYNAAVASVNSGLATALSGCAGTVRIVPINPAMLESDGSLKASCADPDKQHMNKLGAKLLSEPLYAELQDLGINP